MADSSTTLTPNLTSTGNLTIPFTIQEQVCLLIFFLHIYYLGYCLFFSLLNGSFMHCMR